MSDKPLVVIPTYMHKDEHVVLLSKCLESLRDKERTTADLDVILVDDCSPLKNKDKILEGFKTSYNCEVIEKPYNTGFSMTANIGLRKAAREGVTAVLLNMDVEFSPKGFECPNWFQIAMDDPADMVGAKLLYPNGLVQFAGTYYSLLHNYLDHLGRYAPPTMREVNIRRENIPVTGAFQVIKPQVFEKVGFYDEHFKMAYEDVDFCVSGDTSVITGDGIVPAKTLVGKTVKTLCGDGVYRDANWSSYGVQKLLKVSFSDGSVVYATAEHRWPTRNYRRKDNIEWVNTSELIGRKCLKIQPSPQILSDEREWFHGVRNGLIMGDGTLDKRMHGRAVYAQMWQYGDDMCSIVERFFPEENHGRVPWKNNEHRIYVSRICPSLKEIPLVEDITHDYALGFICGLIAADGCFGPEGAPAIWNHSLENIHKIADIARHAGINPCEPRLSRSGNGSYKPQSELWQLTIPRSAVCNTDGSPSALMLLKPLHFRNASGSKRLTRLVDVVSVDDTGVYDKVYCCEEPVTNSWVIGSGISTGNCLRTFLPEEHGGAGLTVAYNPQIFAIHHESIIRGGVKKYSDWHDESWLYFRKKWAKINLNFMVPRIDVEKCEVCKR